MVGEYVNNESNGGLQTERSIESASSSASRSHESPSMRCHISPRASSVVYRSSVMPRSGCSRPA